MKRVVILLMVLILLASTAFALTACVKDEEPDTPKTCTIDTSAWQSDETYHWHGCSGAVCDVNHDKGAHTLGEFEVKIEATPESDGVKARTCTVCGWSISDTIMHFTKVDETGWASAFAYEGVDDLVIISTSTNGNYSEYKFDGSDVYYAVGTGDENNHTFTVVHYFLVYPTEYAWYYQYNGYGNWSVLTVTEEQFKENYPNKYLSFMVDMFRFADFTYNPATMSYDAESCYLGDSIYANGATATNVSIFFEHGRLMKIVYTVDNTTTTMVNAYDSGINILDPYGNEPQ